MPQLRVELEPVTREKVAPGEVRLRATFTSAGDEPVRLDLEQAHHPSLVLEVVDEAGDPVLLPPPSAPHVAKGEAEFLRPGATASVEYAGFLEGSLAPGRYRVRYFAPHEALGGSRDEPLQSQWVELDVGQAVLPPGRKVGPVRRRERPTWLPALLWDISIFIWTIFHRIVCFVRWLFGQRCNRRLGTDVDEERTETISNAPHPFEAWNGTYQWHARFRVDVDEANCVVTVTVRIRLVGAITPAQQTAWETAIENAWSNRFKLCCPCCCCSNGYRIAVDIQFVGSGEHQVVNVGGSTTNMGNWGANDTVDVRHEVGHMLGNLEEYFTINGVDWNGARQPAGSIMNNPANDPAARHYDLMCAAVQRLLGSRCTTRATSQPC